tara:strand:+ start:86 stop:439 length:354 start_codon:yes stop_codon:yes gene_type:complete
MTVRVTKSAKTIEDGILNMKNAMIFDYQGFMPPDNDVRRKMFDDYVNTLSETYGSKYIKVISKGSVSAFIVNTENDKKFRYGDILKPAGWKAPARNASRGNVLDGSYDINWTGACYL